VVSLFPCDWVQPEFHHILNLPASVPGSLELQTQITIAMEHRSELTDKEITAHHRRVQQRHERAEKVHNRFAKQHKDDLKGHEPSLKHVDLPRGEGAWFTPTKEYHEGHIKHYRKPASQTAIAVELSKE
jgi:hypothetical protein